MDLELKGKRALITGAGKGIGRAVAQALAAEGCDVILVARTQSDLEAVATSIVESERGGDVDVTVAKADVSRAADRQGLVDAFGEIDILINNAGAIPGGELSQVDEDTWRAAWDLKVFGYIEMCRLFHEAMKARGQGVIVNIIGGAGEKLNPLYIAGSTGNAGLMAFTRALGARSPDFGIRVVGVNPGMTATERADQLMRNWSQQKFGTPDRVADVMAGMNLPFGRMATPEELADVVTFLASPRASYVSGTIVTVDGGSAHRTY
jgi:3-oxoacyl-[acyl-carrier protein] reductase